MKTYKVNEIFYSLQGEGLWSGTPMVFLRFSGCNLRCPFCDTDFASGEEMTVEEILSAIDAARKEGVPATGNKCTDGAGLCRRVVVTGGEPALQADDGLIAALHSAGYVIHMETNGTRPLPEGIDWITFSPKTDWVKGAEPAIDRADELKLVYTGQDPERWTGFNARHFFLQPCSCRNTSEVVAYVLAHPVWNLSLQTHKYLEIR